MPEWPNGPVSKTGVPFTGTEGSNPSLSALTPHANRRHEGISGVDFFTYEVVFIPFVRFNCLGLLAFVTANRCHL